MYLCEYLPRLEQIAATVETPKDAKLSKLSLENNTLSLSFGQNLVKIPLPVPAKKLAQSSVTNIRQNGQDISISMSLGPTASSSSVAPFMALAAASKWSVRDLLQKTPKSSDNSNEFAFCCAHCSAVVVDSSKYKFVDMPSEFWHELMDFWHCHKPHQDHHLHTGKQYDGKLLPKPGFVNIATSYLLLNSDSSQCSHCGAELGVLDDSVLKIYKWNLTLRYGSSTETYPPHTFVYASILDRVNSSAARKFALRSRTSSVAYTVWVVGVGLDVSLENTTLANCLKILYRQHDDSVEDTLEVPEEVWSSIVEYIDSNNRMLPESARTTSVLEGSEPCEFRVCYLGQSG